MDKTVRVCNKDCDNKPVDINVLGVKHTFCCRKGFNKSMKDFIKQYEGK